MRSSLQRFSPRPIALLFVLLLALPASTSGQIILNEQFNGTAVDTSLFTFSGAGAESFFGRTQLNSPDLPGPFDAPEVSNGTLKLRLQTYNPFGTAAGNLFLGDEIRTIDTYAPTANSGVVFEIRSRLVDSASNPLSPGLVGGMFTFGLDAGFPNPNERDEVDFELLSNLQNGVLTNIFDDQGFNSAGNFQFLPISGFDITQFNDYRLELGLDSIRFYVNDTLIREDFSDLAIEPQDFRLNINAPDSSFGLAFSNLLQPTANPNDNEIFLFEVDSLVIRATAVPEPSTAALLAIALIALGGRRSRKATC